MNSILSFKRNLVIANEMIDFQNDNYGFELQKLINKLTSKIRNKEITSYKQIVLESTLAEIEKSIFRRFGIQVNLTANGDLAAILPFYINKNHILLNEYLRGNFIIEDQEKILKNLNNKQGYIDLKKAKVGGIFSEYKNHLHIDFIRLVNELNMSDDEITAIMLHEIGHAFSACEYSDRLESANQILTNLSKELLNKKQKDLTYIYKELKDLNPNVTEKEADNLVNGNKVIVGYTMFKVLIGTVQSQLSNKKYDETSFEQLADTFVTRLKFGRSLISALDKIAVKYNYRERSRASFMLANLTQLLMFTYGCIVTVGSLMFVPFSGLIFGMFVMLYFISLGEEFKDYTYDELKVRYTRVRNQYIDYIKNSQILNKEEIENILNNIKTIDLAIESTSKNKTLLNRLSNILIPSNYKADTSIEEQQLLEELSFNEIFLKSAELQTR